MSTVLETRHRRRGCPICADYRVTIERAHVEALRMNEPEPEEGGAGFEILEEVPIARRDHDAG